MNPRCVAESRPPTTQAPSAALSQTDVDSLKNVQWTADGTCLLATSAANDIHTFVVPADLLADRRVSLTLASYCTTPSCEPVNAVVSYPSYQLQDTSTTLVLSSVREHPIRLSSALAGHLVASYPLVNPMTEEYITPHSLAFVATGAHFVAGSDSLISTFDTSRLGQEPVTVAKTGPKNSKDDRWNPATSMKGIVSALTIEPGSNILAAGTFTRQVALYNSNGQGSCVGAFSVEGNEADEDIGGRGVTQLHWSPCGRYLYITERKSDGVMIYDIRQTGQLLSWATGRNAYTNQRLGVDIFANDTRGSCEIWAGGTDGKVRVWKNPHLQEGVVKPMFEFVAHADAVTSTTVHHAGGVVATSSGKNYALDEDCTALTDCPDPRLKIWTI